MAAFAHRPKSTADRPVDAAQAAGLAIEGEDTPGPFTPEVNAALTRSFGQSLENVQVERGKGDEAKAIDAHAFTEGSRISLGDNVREDMGDPRSMEIISHEVAHALGAGSGSTTRELDGGRDSAGERDAHEASSSFRDFVAGGAQGPAPQLEAASGDAAIHRFEAGEHADAVDHAADTLKQNGMKVDQGTADAMAKPIKLKNGVTVTPGQITAMMGDFYGAYTTGPDGKEHFDPMASFEALNNADPKEMKGIMVKIEEEQKKVTDQKNGGEAFKPSDNSDLERLTNDRHLKTDANGTTTGYTFMDLAQKNTNHFNQKNETITNPDGTTSFNPDNNMGAYGVLHLAAMKAAQDAAKLPPGSDEAKEAADRARALEASSQHFETDRFSAGHQFDKEKLVADNGGGKMANIKARIEHDKYNDEGTMLKTGNPDDDPWFAKGDSHWADKDNEGNRAKTAKATMASFSEVNDILNGKATADGKDATNATDGAKKYVPAWNQDFDDKVQKEAKDAITPGALWDQVGELPLLPAMAESWAKGKLHKWEDEEGTDNAWDMMKSKGGKALDWAEKKGSDGLDWAEKKGGDLLDWGKEKGGELLKTGGEAVNWAEKKGGDAIDWVKNDSVDWAKKTGSDGLDWAEKKGGELLQTGGEAVNWAEKKGGDAIDWVKNDSVDWAKKTGGDAVNWGEKKLTQAGGAIADGASSAWGWAGDKADAAKKAFGHLFD